MSAHKQATETIIALQNKNFELRAELLKIISFLEKNSPIDPVAVRLKIDEIDKMPTRQQL